MPTSSPRYAPNVKLDVAFLSPPLFLYEWRQTNSPRRIQRNGPSWHWHQRRWGLEEALRGQPIWSYTDRIWGTASEHADGVALSLWAVTAEHHSGSDLPVSRVFAVKRSANELKVGTLSQGSFNVYFCTLFVVFFLKHRVFMMKVLHDWNGKISFWCNMLGV